MKRWRILHLTAAVAETSGQYNEHCLPFVGKRDLTICSFHAPAIETDPEIRSLHGGGSSLGYLRALREALAGEQPYDVIHAHSARAGVLFLLMALLRPGHLARSVYTVQNSYQNYHLGNRLLLIPIFAGYRRIVTCSEACRQSLPWWLRRLGGSRIRVVQNAVDVGRVTRSLEQAERRHADAGFVVASVGRLIEIKNPFTLLDAFARSAGSSDGSPDGSPVGSDWKLVFVGEGALRAEVEADAESRKIAHQVQTTGLVPRDEVFEHAGAADLFVSTSRGEGLPVAVLEALACGCPAVLSDIPPHREVVADATFIPLVETEDAAGFAREISRFAAMPAEERAAIGARCREHVEELFGLPVMHAALERVYNEVCTKVESDHEPAIESRGMRSEAR